MEIAYKGTPVIEMHLELTVGNWLSVLLFF